MNTYRVSRSLVFQGGIFVPEQDYELTQEQISGLRERGALIEDSDSTSPSETRSSGLESELLDRLQPYAGLADQNESPIHVLERIISTLNEAHGELSLVDAVLARRDELDDLPGRSAKISKAISVASKADRAVAERDEARAGLESARTELEKTRTELENTKLQATAAPASVDPIALVKSLGTDTIANLIKDGFDSLEKIASASDERLNAVKGVGTERLKELRALAPAIA